jgi:hypothetical protein
MKKFVQSFPQRFCFLFFDPKALLQKWRGIPYYLRNKRRYISLNNHRSFDFDWKNAFPVLHERFEHAGLTRGHYFWQDLWAAQHLYNRNTKNHVDVGSRLDGFIAHIIPFCKVTYIDIRPLSSEIDNLEFKQGSILDMPFEDRSVESLSCLHVLEHIGLGRYNDSVDPDGHVKAAQELMRVLSKGSELLIGAPVGQERLCFDAHRIFDPQTITDMFSGLHMVEFCLIDDEGMKIFHNASFDDARHCYYGCGLFVFRK